MFFPSFLALVAGSPPPGSSLSTISPGPGKPAPDIRGIVPPQPYYLSAGMTWLIIAGVSLLLAGALAWYLFFRKSARPVSTGPFISPRDLALQRLRTLDAQVEAMDARTFGAAVCDTLRVYIGSEYRLHPERQTSPEFLAAIARSGVFSRLEQGLLAEFLEGCDLLKFARQDATPAGKRALLNQAIDFVEGGSRLRSSPPELPGPVPPAGSPPPIPVASNADARMTAGAL